MTAPPLIAGPLKDVMQMVRRGDLADELRTILERTSSNLASAERSGDAAHEVVREWAGKPIVSDTSGQDSALAPTRDIPPGLVNLFSFCFGFLQVFGVPRTQTHF